MISAQISAQIIKLPSLLGQRFSMWKNIRWIFEENNPDTCGDFT